MFRPHPRAAPRPPPARPPSGLATRLRRLPGLRGRGRPASASRAQPDAYSSGTATPLPCLRARRDVSPPHSHPRAREPEPVAKPNFKKPHGASWHGLMTSSLGAGNGFMSDRLYQGIATHANLVLVKTGNRRGRRIHGGGIHRALAGVIANRDRFDIRVVNISLGGDHVTTGRLTELDRLVEEA